MGFNSGFKGLKQDQITKYEYPVRQIKNASKLPRILILYSTREGAPVTTTTITTTIIIIVIIIIIFGKSLENIPLQGLSCRCETMLNVHLAEQGLRTWKENLICDIFHKGYIVKAIINLRVPSNI